MFRTGEAPWQIKFLVPETFSFEFYDPTCSYPSGTVFYYDMYGPYHDMIVKHLDQGYRVIFDAKNEHYINMTHYYVLYKFLQHPGQGCFLISGSEADLLPGVKIIATPYWYWILDQRNLLTLKIDQHARNWQIQKKFFMSLSLQRAERDYLWEKLGSLLDDSLHSYRHRGVFLPNDCVHDVPVAQDHPSWQRYINPQWMDSTAFTLAVETYVDETATTGYSLTSNNNLFLCEKTYKPLAAQHPLLMVGTSGNLAYMRSQGFESFPELFDESYDDISDWQQRVDRIVEIVKDFDVGSVHQPTVRAKLQHNHAHFFNQELTKKHALETIQQPLLDFIYG